MPLDPYTGQVITDRSTQNPSYWTPTGQRLFGGPAGTFFPWDQASAASTADTMAGGEEWAGLGAQGRNPSPGGIAGSGLTGSDVIGMASYAAAPWLAPADVAGASAAGATGGGFGSALGAEGMGAGSGAVGADVIAGAGSAAPVFGSALGAEGMGAGSGAVGADVIPAGPAGPVMLNASSPVTTLDPATAMALGINADPIFGGPAFETTQGTMAGGAPTFGENAFGGGYVGEPTGQWGGPTGMETGAGTGALDTMKEYLKKLGLTPATAGLLGISGLQALSKPKLPQAAQDLQKTAGPAAAAATGVIQSGGTSGPAWATQKASIDATIDQQLKEQTAAMMQQAVNSGVGADSQVTQQQINKLKNQLETQRQTLYAQAQAQNVQAALQELGISDAALASVADTQFKQSAAARAGAAQTASLALMLATLGKA